MGSFSAAVLCSSDGGGWSSQGFVSVRVLSTSTSASVSVSVQVVRHPLLATRQPMKELGLQGHPKVEATLRRFLCDSLRTQLCVQYSTHDLACGLVFLAALQLKLLPKVGW